MPIDPRFLNTAKDRASAIKRSGVQYIKQQPKLAAGTAVAMLVAPAVLRNENRDYLQTAAFTTPLIGAASYAGHALGQKAADSLRQAVGRNQANQHWNSKVAQISEVSYADIKTAQKAYENKSLSRSLFNAVQRKYYAGRKRAPFDPIREGNSLLTQSERLLGSANESTSLRYLSNAIHAEKLRMGAADLSAYARQLAIAEDGEAWASSGLGSLPAQAPALTRDQIRAELSAQVARGNKKFIQGMNSRVQRFRDIVVTPPSTNAAINPIEGYGYGFHKWSGARGFRKKVFKQRKDLGNAINAAIASGHIDADELMIKTTKDGDVVGFTLPVRGSKSDLLIPMVGEDGLAVAHGSHFQRTVLARKVWTQTEKMTSDVFAFRALALGHETGAVKEAINSINIHGLVANSKDFMTYSDPEYGEILHGGGNARFRRHEIVANPLFGFGPEGTKGFGALKPEEVVDVVRTVPEKLGMTSVGSEGNVPKGTFQEGHMADLATEVSLERQDTTWRALTKPIRNSRPEDILGRGTDRIRDNRNPFYRTNKAQLEGVVDNGVGVRVGTISPAEYSIFSTIPEGLEQEAEVIAKRMVESSSADYNEVASKAYAEAFINRNRFDLHAQSILQAEYNLSVADSEKAWSKMVDFLAKPGRIETMRKVGRVGEGEFLVQRNLYGMRVERYVGYDVDTPLIEDFDTFFTADNPNGISLEKRFGRSKQGVALGFRNGNVVTPNGVDNYLVNRFAMGDGLYRQLVLETKDIGTGTKANVGSQKGNIVAAETSQELSDIREGLNTLRSAAGDQMLIPAETNVLVARNYYKSHQMADTLGNIMGDSLRRLDEGGDLDAFLATWKKPFDDLGLVYLPETGTFEWDVQSGRVANRAKQQKQVMLDALKDLSERMVRGDVKSDPFMRGWIDYRNKGGDLGWADYVNQVAQPDTFRVTDDMHWNRPAETKMAPYTMQHLTMTGHHGAAADIVGRLKYDGDVEKTRELLDYLNGDNATITRTMTLEEATGGKTLRSLSHFDYRVGTVFDPSNEAAAGNFLLQLPSGRSVPVLGHDAYGGKANQYGTGKFSTSDHELALLELIKEEQAGRRAAKLEKLHQQYIDSITKFIHGKESLYRSGAVDPLGITGRFATRPSSLRYTDGTVNPFEIGMGEEMINSIKDAKIRGAISRGEDVFMAVTREPVSDVAFYRLRHDPNLNGTNMFGLDEGARNLFMADADGDYIAAHALVPGSDGHTEALAEVYGEQSIQRDSIGWLQSLVGVGDDQRLNVGTKVKSLTKRMSEAKSLDFSDAMVKRSTSGGIGRGSNVYLKTVMALEENSRVTDVRTKKKLTQFFFQGIKQGPISAAKLKSSLSMDYSKALNLAGRVNYSLGENGTFDQFYNSMLQVAQTADGDNDYFTRFVQENRPALEEMHAGFDRAAINQAHSAMTMDARAVSEGAMRGRRLGVDRGLFSYVQAAADTAEEASAGATASAEVLGAINEAITAAKDIGEIAKKSKVGLAVGLGIAAAAIAGVASTKLDRPYADFGQASGSKYRPEEAHPGKDMVPGDGPAGSRAAAKPPRVVVPGPASTRTSVVAPLGETRDLDVKLRAQDAQRAHRTAKIISRMTTDGDANVTINYRNRMNPKSFRTKERMRDAMES